MERPAKLQSASLRKDEARKRAIKQKMGLTEPKNLKKRVIGAIDTKECKLKRPVDVPGGPFDGVLPGIILLLGTSMSGKTTWIINAVMQKALFGGMKSKMWRLHAEDLFKSSESSTLTFI